MNELVKIPFGDPQRTGLVLPGGLTEPDWKSVGHNLCRCKDSLNFWIGDWLNYGNAAFGEKYTTAMEIFRDEGSAGYGLSEGTLRNLASVASRVQLSLRRDKLSWSHHVAVADNFTEDRDKDTWLAKAVMGKWSVAMLVAEIRRKNKVKEAGEINTGAGGFMFDGWLGDWRRGLLEFPVDKWQDDELLKRIRQIEEIEKPLIDEKEKRGLAV